MAAVAPAVLTVAAQAATPAVVRVVAADRAAVGLRETNKQSPGEYLLAGLLFLSVNNDSH